MTNPTLTIGIPAYNEQANIGYLLSDLLKQVQTNFKLKKIIVYSDGSTDNTVVITKKIKSSLIKIINNPNRQGVAVGLNAICQTARSDILVILAADVAVPDPNLINKLIQPIVKGQADLTSGLLQALPPKTWLEKIIYIGRIYQNKVFHHHKNGHNLYTCYGAVRAMSRRLYQQINFPASVGEDMYNYLFCIQKGYQFKLAKSAVINYKLPENFADHRRQSVRYFRSKDRMIKEFGKKFINQHTYIPANSYLLAGIWAFTHYPVNATAYALITATTKILSLFDQQAAMKDVWERAGSTTVLKN